MLAGQSGGLWDSQSYLLSHSSHLSCGQYYLGQSAMAYQVSHKLELVLFPGCGIIVLNPSQTLLYQCQGGYGQI